ncbi:DUF3039 domain-containing protein [Mycobacterium sp. D16R24]|uniref:DUF3039 domain-containing protein n=1 Tax=Mycobacterium sp. D16R24 TaxID=1855656 RepID=UPI0009945D3A|nr:DUF3039 domain-containing protein [Mycobacterium sp. D16R24]
MAGLARPTLRCLGSDLVDDWGNTSHQRLAGTGVDGGLVLSALDHPLIRHTVELFTENYEEIRRATISGLSDPKFYKAKTTRWRGAVYVDPNGQAWLVAGGLRREGDRSDFYKSFCADIAAHGAGKYLPTDEDHDRLRREELDSDFVAWETRVHDATLDALARTEGALTVEWKLYSFDGSVAIADFALYVEVLEGADDDPDGYGEIVLQVTTTDWQHQELIKHAEIVAMCAIDCREASWTPGHAGNERIYSICDGGAQIAGIIAAAQDPSNVHPKQVRPSECAHYTHRELLTDQYVNGIPAKALCGKFFVPRQLPDALPMCAECDGIQRSMEAALT